MILEELTVEHTRGVIQSWNRNFGFWGHNGDIYLEFPEILLNEVLSDLSERGFYENRLGIGIEPNDDCKLKFRIGDHDQVEVGFGVNRGRRSSQEYSHTLEKAEAQFKIEMIAIGLGYYK